MGPIGFQEILLIAIVALLVFEPGKIPEIARTIGRTLAYFRRATDDVRHSVEKAMYEDTAKITPTQPGPEKQEAAAAPVPEKPENQTP